jgi:pimeloyl-ACP methyl ester carboxylesterase
MHSMPDAYIAPSKALLAVEAPRSALEFLAGWLSRGRIADELPKGDGGPVVIFPGLAFGDFYTSLLRDFLNDIGYASYGWGRGINTGPADGDLDALLGELLEDVTRIHREHKRPVRLVGWSLGGIYARELAKMAPKLVHQVVTLGTPFSGTSDATNCAKLFELLSRSKVNHDPLIAQRVAEPPPVRTISVYSKTDGVVAWQASQNPKRRNLENVELSEVSHLGMVTNPAVLRTLATKFSEAPASAEVVELDFRRQTLCRAA